MRPHINILPVMNPHTPSQQTRRSSFALKSSITGSIPPAQLLSEPSYSFISSYYHQIVNTYSHQRASSEFRVTDNILSQPQCSQRSAADADTPDVLRIFLRSHFERPAVAFCQGCVASRCSVGWRRPGQRLLP
jgi:hypothetical protein